MESTIHILISFVNSQVWYERNKTPFDYFSPIKTPFNYFSPVLLFKQLFKYTLELLAKYNLRWGQVTSYLSKVFLKAVEQLSLQNS